MDINVKTCPVCKKRLPFEAFSMDRASVDGFCRICKRCRSTTRPDNRRRRTSRTFKVGERLNQE